MIGKTILAVVAIAAIGALYLNTSQVSNYEGEFQNFIQDYRRSYFSKEEYNFRYSVFAENLKKIEEMNANPDDQATYGINDFADWTHEEFMKLNGLAPLSEEDKAKLPKPSLQHAEPLGAADHTGKMNGIKNQGSCGSCWAFAANGVHEVTWNMQRGRNFDLSEQQLVDCSRGYRNQGCNGGWYFWAWDYVASFGGLNTQQQYKYVAYDQACQANTGDRNAPISQYRQIAQNSQAV